MGTRTLSEIASLPKRVKLSDIYRFAREYARIKIAFNKREIVAKYITQILRPSIL